MKLNPLARAALLEHWFAIRQRGSTLRTEILGGATTFAAMAYIIVVNPAILQFEGVSPEALTVATILAAIFGCLFMGLYANRPLAVAPYMGENAFIAYTLAALGITWQERLGTVFVAGLVFVLITVLRLRSWLADAVSTSMKYSFGVGIGLFLTFIGLNTSGIVVHGPPAPAPPVQLVNFHPKADDKAPPSGSQQAATAVKQALIAVGGFILITILLTRKVRGAILLGIIGTGIAAYLLGVGKAPERVVALPDFGPQGLGQIAFQLEITSVLRWSFLPILITLILVSFLDTLGTLIGVGAAGDMLDKHGNFPEVEKPMIVDAVSCVFSALVGTSTSGAFIESAAGVREGARTGIAAITVAVLFALSLFFIPLVAPLQQLGFVYGPALIAVGLLMMGSVSRIDFEDMTEGVPAFATIAMMVFTYNIANGLTAGLILYPVFKLVAGRAKEVKVGSYVLAGLCLVYFVFGMPH